jgi:hypothetical protein
MVSLNGVSSSIKSGIKAAGASIKNAGKTVGKGTTKLIGSSKNKGLIFKPAADGGKQVRTSTKWIGGTALLGAAVSPLGPVLAGNAGETVGGLVGGLGEGLFGNIGLVAGSSSFAICCIVMIMAMMIFAN